MPYWGWALVTNASFVLLGLFGMVLLTKVQWATLVFYFAGLAVAVWALIHGWDDRVSLERMRGWWALNPNNAPFDGWTVLEVTSAYIGVLGAILAVFTTDVARFMRREQRGFGGMFFVAVNTIIPVVIMYVTGIMMLAASGQPDPGVTLVRLIGSLGLAVTLVTQVRINLLNLYGGTLGLANFFSRIFGFVPGRQFWAVPFLLVATGIILTPFREHFGQITIYISVFLCAWVSTLIGERVLGAPGARAPVVVRGAARVSARLQPGRPDLDVGARRDRLRDGIGCLRRPRPRAGGAVLDRGAVRAAGDRRRDDGRGASGALVRGP